MTVEDVMNRLELLGVDEPDADKADFCLQLAQEKLLADLGIPELPVGLTRTWADMAAGLYLTETRAKDREAAGATVKSITEGDVRVEYGGSGAADMSALIARLVRPSESILAAYRRVRW